MKYRIFGRTKWRISALGFGMMRLPVIGGETARIDERVAMDMALHAVDRGVNYFDTAYPYHTADFSKGGASEPFLAKVLKQVDRDSLYIATKLPSWHVRSRKDMDRYLEEQLRRLDTESIDCYLLHALNTALWKKLTENGVFEFLESALRSGKIRYAGFSFHDRVELFKEIVDAYDWTFCQIQYNYFDTNYQAGRAGLEYAAAKDLAVVVMEPLRGGCLVQRLPDEAKDVLRKAAPERTPAEWALRWVWNHPEVSVVLSGMSDLDQMRENVALAETVSDAEWTEKDEKAVQETVRIIQDLQKVDCTSCGYCLPCPEGVDIPRNFSLYNDHFVFHDPAAKMRYRNFLVDSAKASNCADCGRCEEKCPQAIPIRRELKNIVDLFG